VSAGSYLLDVHCLNYVFAPLRVDVKDAPSEGEAAVTVYQTFRGNEWSNLGERKGYPIVCFYYYRYRKSLLKSNIERDEGGRNRKRRGEKIKHG